MDDKMKAFPFLLLAAALPTVSDSALGQEQPGVCSFKDGRESPLYVSRPLVRRDHWECTRFSVFVAQTYKEPHAANHAMFTELREPYAEYVASRRRAGENVIETGWTDGQSAPPPPPAQAPRPTQASPVPAATPEMLRNRALVKAKRRYSLCNPGCPTTDQ
jgi:hypothetical protein